MERVLFRAAEALWMVCAFSPIVVFAVQKIKKQMAIKMFAVGFVLYLIWSAAVLFRTVFPILLVVISGLVLVFLFGIFSDSDGYNAAAVVLGTAQCSMSYLAISAIASAEFLINKRTVSCCEETDYYDSLFLIVWAAIKAVAVFLSAFALKKLCSSPKMRETKAGLAGILTVAAAEMLPVELTKIIFY